MKDVSPPKLPLKLLKWFCKSDYYIDIEGDLLELYDRRKKTLGHKNAKLLLFKDVLLLFKPGIIRTFRTSQKLNYYDMFQHTLLITFRSFKRYKSIFLINLIGLSSGLTVALLIYLWINDQLLVDKFHKNDSRLYQVFENIHINNQMVTSEETPGLLAQALQDELPEVEYATSVIPTNWFQNNGILSFQDKIIKASAQFAGKNFFDIFSYQVIEGNIDQVLSDKNAVLLSDEHTGRLYRALAHAACSTVEK